MIKGPSYRFSDSGYASEFEDEDGHCFSEERWVGQGSFSTSRLFLSATSVERLVIHRPKPPTDFLEVANKKRFFKKVYPSSTVHFFKKPDDYRFVHTYIEGTTLDHLPTEILIDHKYLILQSTISAVSAAHDKGLVIVDLKSNNIVYDPQTNICRLIDGGDSCIRGKSVTYNKFTNKEKKVFKENCPYLAPECWLENSAADYPMDIYALGWLFNQFQPEDEEVAVIVERCLNIDPNMRPQLTELAEVVSSYLNNKFRP